MDAKDLLASIAGVWTRCQKKAADHKQQQFGDTAELVWKYYGQRHDFVYEAQAEGGFPGGFQGDGGHFWRATVGATSEYVRLMLPYIFNRTPHLLAQPDRPSLPPELLGPPVQMDPMTGQPVMDPMTGQPVPNPQLMAQQQLVQMDQVRAGLLQWFLNYLNHANDLRKETRPAVIEALTKGRGVVWFEVWEGPLGDVPLASYMSVDDLFIDPDAESLREAGWIMRRRREPVWRVAEEYGLDEEKLRGMYRSRAGAARQEAIDVGIGDVADPKSVNDVLVYYEVYSRQGAGQRFYGADENLKEVREVLESVGPNVFLVICPGVNFPLNLDPEKLAVWGEQEIRAALEWPVPFQALPTTPWPFEELDFYPRIDGPWATSPLESAIPLQAFLDHAYSFLMDRIKTTCRDFWLVSSDADPKLEKLLMEGMDQEIVKIKGAAGQGLRNLVDVLSHPSVNRDLFEIVSGVKALWEEATGVNEILAGRTPQRAMRSAQEAALVGSTMSIRPDDMAEMVEDWHSRIGQKLAFMSRLGIVSPETIASLAGEDQQPQMGPDGQPMPGPVTMTWLELVQTDDLRRAACEVDIQVEAGTGRKKNKAKQLQDVADSAQFVLPLLMQYAQATGYVDGVNAWLRMWCEAQDVDWQPFMLPPPPMPPQGATPPGGPPGEEEPPPEEPPPPGPM